MNLHYSRYSNLPADRDLERLSADLRALPASGQQRSERPALRSWVARHVPLRTLHA